MGGRLYQGPHPYCASAAVVTHAPCPVPCPSPARQPQEAWRAAASERARREMEGREAAVRRQLAAEQEEELRVVVGRLEEEALAREAAAQVGLGGFVGLAGCHLGPADVRWGGWKRLWLGGLACCTTVLQKPGV